MFDKKAADFDLPTIDWRMVYNKLGTALPKDLVIEPDPWGFWSPVVDQSISYFKILDCYTKLGITLWNMNSHIVDHDWVPKNGIWRGDVSRSLSPEIVENSGGVSSQELILNKVQAITLRAQLILNLGLYLTTGQHLDVDGSGTMCAGSYFSEYGPLNQQQLRDPNSSLYPFRKASPSYQDLPHDMKFVPYTLFKVVEVEKRGKKKDERRLCVCDHNPVNRTVAIRPRIINNFRILSV